MCLLTGLQQHKREAVALEGDRLQGSEQELVMNACCAQGSSPESRISPEEGEHLKSSVRMLCGGMLRSVGYVGSL